MKNEYVLGAEVRTSLPSTCRSTIAEPRRPRRAQSALPGSIGRHCALLTERPHLGLLQNVQTVAWQAHFVVVAVVWMTVGYVTA
jgi:hypothetical protein